MTTVMGDKVKLIIKDSSNLPEFTLLFQFEDDAIKSKYVEAVQDQHVQEMINGNTLFGEFGSELSLKHINRFFEVYTENISHRIKEFRVTEEGIEVECELVENDKIQLNLLSIFIDEGKVRFTPRLLVGNGVYYFVTIDMVMNTN